MASQKFVGGTQNLWVWKTCEYMYSKFEFCGYSNLWVFKICGCSKFIYTQNLRDLRLVGTQKIVGTQFSWYSYSKNYY